LIAVRAAPLPRYTDRVRGDSRRDLYAKTMALFGLGMLAGTGALVDYWPVGIRFPQPMATSGAAPPTVATALPVPPGALTTAYTLPVVERLARLRREPSEPSSLPVALVAEGLGVELPLAELPPPVLLLNARHEVSFPEAGLIGLPAGPPPAAPAAGSTEAFSLERDDRPGFIRTAFIRTGSSLVRTGVRTGTSLADAVKVVGNVVRRAFPD
jgi:hypothetical protein